MIVISHWENQRKRGGRLSRKIFLNRINAKIPVGNFIGAYHILTRYLRVKRELAKIELLKTLELHHPSLIPDVTVDHAIAAIKNAVKYRIEGWDGYIISLADALGASIVYTIDQRLTKVRHLSIVIPISKVTLQRYHQWVREKLGRYRSI